MSLNTRAASIPIRQTSQSQVAIKEIDSYSTRRCLFLHQMKLTSFSLVAEFSRHVTLRFLSAQSNLMITKSGAGWERETAHVQDTFRALSKRWGHGARLPNWSSSYKPAGVTGRHGFIYRYLALNLTLSSGYFAQNFLLPRPLLGFRWEIATTSKLEAAHSIAVQWHW